MDARRSDLMRSESYSTVFFESEERLLAAAREARLRGLAIEDVYTPYAVHGMEEAAGIRTSRLARISLTGGLTGLTLGLVM